MSMPAAAQLAENQPSPPYEYHVDANGVDLVSGQFYFPMTDVSIGGAEGKLSFTRTLQNSGYSTTFDTALNDWGGEYDVVIGSVTDHFTSASDGLSTERTGARLSTAAGGAYVYTTRDGTQYKFSGSLFSTRIRVAQHRVNQIVYPDGRSLWIAYDVNSSPSYHLTRPKSVQSNDGFRLTFGYQADWISGADGFSKWMTLASVTASNAAVSYCASGACAGGRTTTYSWNADNSQETRTDAAGRGFITTFDTSGRITGIKRIGASVNLYTISYSGYKVSTVQTPSGLWQYSYSAVSNPSSGNATRTTTVTSPTGLQRVVTIAHYKNKIVADRTGTGGTTTYEYDSQKRLTKVSAPEGNAISYQYDARDNLISAEHIAKGGSTSYTVSASYPTTCSNPVTCNKPTSTTDARGYTTNYSYDPSHGGVTSITEPSPDGTGIRPERRFTYVARSAMYYSSSSATTTGSATVLSSISECASGSAGGCVGTAQETRTDIVYPASGTLSNRQPLSVTVRAGNSSVSATRTLGYTDFGQVETVDGPLTGTADTTTYSYDAVGNLSESRLPDPDGSSARGSVATRFIRDAQGRLTDTQTGHYPNGNFTPSAFVIAQTNKSEYDSATALKSSESLIAGGATVRKTQYAYDNDGRLTCVTQRMNAAAFNSTANACALGPEGGYGSDRIKSVEYDTAGRIKRITDGYGTTYASVERTLTYTANGNISTLTDAENNRTTYEYDGQDRLAKTRYPVTGKGAQSSSTTDYELLGYDNAGHVTSRRLRDGTGIVFSYDNLGRLKTKDLPGSEPDITYAYDQMNRAVSIAQGSQTLSFTYDALGRNLTQVGPQGTTSYTYDTAGRRLTMSYPGGALTINYDYDAVGNVTKIRENGATSGVGVLATYAFDTIGRPGSVTFGNGSTQSFGYDTASRLSTMTNNLGGSATTHDLSQTFTYNPASQIATVARSNDAYAWKDHYNVDRTYIADGLNRIMSAGGLGFSYDARGNLTNDGTNAYSYTAENLLKTGPSGAAFTYDPLGRLYQTVGGGVTTRLQYDGTEMIAEYNASNAVQRRYVHGPGTDNPIVWYEGSAISSSTRRFLMADERGSIVSITDSSGATVNLNAYDEYGIPAPSNLGRFGYTGQAWLPEVRMWYYKARIYSPTLGRFMQSDPIGYEDGMNWYNYAANDPINFADPLGLEIIIVNGEKSKNELPAFPLGFDFDWSQIQPYTFDLSQLGFDPNEIVVTAQPKPKQGPCGVPGPRLNVSFGGAATLFGFPRFDLDGSPQVGGSVSANAGLSIPLISIFTRSPVGVQPIFSATATGLAGRGVFGGMGPTLTGSLSASSPQSGTSTSEGYQGGAAWGQGVEVSGNTTDKSLSISAGIPETGFGLYYAEAQSASYTFAPCVW